eukprot:m51a1_g12654 hypothetical protein (609) ;mRNA; r:152-2326
MHSTAPAVLCALLACLAASGASAYGVAPNCSVAEVVIGQTTGTTQVERGGAEGLRAAIAQAKLLTSVPLKLVQLNHSSDNEMLTNVRRLVEENCAMIIACTKTTSTMEPKLLSLLKSYGVPFVGSQTASQDLRSTTNGNNTATFTRNSRSVTLPFVVNIRASGSDEFNAVLSLLSQNWSTLSRIGLIARDSLYGHWAYNYIDDSLQVLLSTPGTGLTTKVFIPQGTVTDAQMSSSMTTFFTGKAPQTIISCALPDVTAQYLSWLASSGHTGLKVYIVSYASAMDMYTLLDTSTRALLDSKGIEVYFTQSMPDTKALWTSIPLIRKFNRTATSSKSRATLEGYLTGWFLYEAVQQTVARNGLPLTIGDFLYTIFADVRTFNVQGMTLGPYGDGGISGGASTQSADDACNQGVHEVFMTRWSPSNNSQTTVSGSAFKFAECMAPKWSSGTALTIVGSIDDCSSDDATVRSGLLGAVSDHNSEGENTILLRSMTGSSSALLSALQTSSVVAVASPILAQESNASLFKEAGVALVSPMPGLWGLRRPFQRSIINLFPSAYDEAVAAFVLLRSLGVTSVAVLRNDNSTYTQQCVTGLDFANKSVRSGSSRMAV